jgi:uncharacterized protein (DUF736 family)
MIIGNFTYDQAEDTYTGDLSTLSVAVRKVVFRPNDSKTANGPDYRVIGAGKAGDVEIGGAWKKRSQDSDRKYLSVSVDDPSLAQPLNCALVEGDGEGFILIWSRDKRQS